MKRYFITYGDALFEDAKRRIIREAEQTGQFDEIIAYSNNNVSEELKASKVFSVKRGGGLWSWKPDIILQTLNIMDEGDTLVYCDAGCQLQPCQEWKHYWKILRKYDIIAQRIYQRTENWTRKELIDEFVGNGEKWPKMFQFQATIIIRKSEFTTRLIREWRELMIQKPILAMDVNDEERKYQKASFIENRHDQAIYSALVYKYLRIKDTKDKIYTMWEHLEDLDIFSKQAIRAARYRTNIPPTKRMKIRLVLKRVIKDAIYKPLLIAPQQILYGYLNELSL